MTVYLIQRGSLSAFDVSKDVDRSPQRILCTTDVIYSKVLAIKGVQIPFISVVMYAVNASTVLQRSRLTPTKSMREGHSEIGDFQILYTGLSITH